MLTAVLLVIAVICYLILCRLDLKRPAITGAFVVPGLPVVGNALQVYNNPSRTFLLWARRYNKPVFVIYLGRVPVVVVNTYRDVAALWRSHSVSMGSRPVLHTFHEVVSAEQGWTVGTTPAGQSFRRKKKAISLHLAPLPANVPTFAACLDANLKYILKHLLVAHEAADSTLKCAAEISFRRYALYFVLRCALALTYGYEIDALGSERQLADTVIRTENQIIRLRSLITNCQDYLPILGLGPLRACFEADAVLWRRRRDRYMDVFMRQFEERLQSGHEPTCRSMLARVLQDTRPEHVLSRPEARSLCLSMVSAGLDNVSLVVDHVLGQLARSTRGAFMQLCIHRELLQTHGTPLSAWIAVPTACCCPYAMAVIDEALRFFTVLPLSLPRATVKDITYRNMFIPAGTAVVMNAYAANHDASVYPQPHEFRPERWLNDAGKIDKHVPGHFLFGAGSRNCSGSNLAIKEIYTMVCRTVLLFQVRPPADPAKAMVLDPVEGNMFPSATAFEPRPFYVRLQLRRGDLMKQLHAYVYS